MLLRRFTDFILQNRLRTMGLVFALGFLPLLGSISILVAAFVTLRRGAQEGFLILIAATLPMVIEGFTSQTPAIGAGNISNLDILTLMVVNNVLTWVFAEFLRKYVSWSLLLQVAALLGVVIVMVAHLVFPDIQAWWQTNLTDYLLNTMQMVNQLSPSETLTQKASLSRIVETMSPYATGFVVISVVFYALLQVVLARWWQAYMYNPGGLRKELYNIRLGYVTGIVFLICVGLSLTGNATTVDMISILYLTFALAGLSIVHTLSTLSKTSWLWIGLVYVSIVLVPWILILIALMGLLDAFFDIRKQLKKRQLLN